MKKIGSLSGEPASPGLASNGKPLRIRLVKCPLERIAEIKQNSKVTRGFSVEAKSNRMMSMTGALNQFANRGEYVPVGGGNPALGGQARKVVRKQPPPQKQQSLPPLKQ